MIRDAGRVDISEQLDMLLQKLGFPNRSVVSEVHIGVQDVTVLYYPLNEGGHKHIADDGSPVTRWLKVRVTT